MTSTTKTERPYSSADEKKLMVELWDSQIADNPLNFVMFAFPWGKKGTPLENFTGPRAWQKRELLAIAAHIKENKNRQVRKQTPLVYQSATASGRGIGKSALVAWLNLWMMSTKLGATVINTANTEAQLKSRTWAEVGKWHTLAINSHWFEKTALSLKPAEWFETALKKQLKIDTGYFYSQAQLWSEENPDAFAGVHNLNGMMLIYDEASGIPAPIWKVSEGFFTDPSMYRFWFVFSNPRRNTGAFFECFHVHRDYWKTRNIDSRTVEGTDQDVLKNIVEKYGEDSDEARIEVKGEFPRQGDKQFISREIVMGATTRELIKDPYAALIMGVDVARFGDDSTVFYFRQGRDGRSIPPVVLKNKDNMEVAREVAHWIEKVHPDAVCIDAGNGSGVIDILRDWKHKIYEIPFGGKADSEEWANRRTELWARIREWLGGGCLPESNKDLEADLVGPEYKFQGNGDKIMLEPKEQMKRRGIHSPDIADALACTFAIKIPRRDDGIRRDNVNSQRSKRLAKGINYKIF